MSNVIDFAAAKLRRERNPPKPEPFLSLEIDGVRGLAILSGRDFDNDYAVTEEWLTQTSDFFRSWSKVFSDRRGELRRVAEGNCATLFCKRLPWRGTGLCRECCARLIEKARRV